MARIYGLNGVITGRQGANVFRVRRGTQVLTKYQPVVLNPRSDAQVAQRARFTLMAKLGATFAPSILYVGAGAASPRNLFMKRNIRLVETSQVSGSGLAAVEPLSNLEFTNGTEMFANVMAEYDTSGKSVNVTGTLEAFANIRTIVYMFVYEVAETGYDPAASNYDAPLRLIATTSKPLNGGAFELAAGVNDHDKNLVVLYAVEYSESTYSKINNYGNPDANTALLRLVQEGGNEVVKVSRSHAFAI